MISHWAADLLHQTRALWKRSLSYRKKDWQLRDYPIRFRKLKVDPTFDTDRFKQARYVASIINWWVIGGTGETTAEALANLDKTFESEKINRLLDAKPMPRPGTHVPLQFASQVGVNKHAALSEDFIRQILDLEWALITDESSLWDFHAQPTNDYLFSKIQAIYGVDVSDIQSGRLTEIFDRIAASRSRN